MLATAAGGIGAVALLALGGAKEARADSGVLDVRITNKDVGWINAATEDTLKTRLQPSDLTFTKELGRVALILTSGGAPIDPRDRNWSITETIPVSGSLGRSWTITETVPVSSTTLATAAGQSATQPRNITQIAGTLLTGRDWSSDFSKLDVALSTVATQTTLALIKTKTDNLDAALSTLATATGQSTTQPRNLTQIGGTIQTARDWSTDFSKLDVALSTRLKLTDYVITQELGRVGLILSAGGAIIDPRDVSDRAARLVGVVYGSQAQQLLQRAVTFDLQTQLRTAGTEYDARQIRTLASTDVVDVFDRAARLAGRVSVAASDGGAAIDPRDVSDRAARLLGVVYGSQAQQLLQRAVSFDLQVQLRTAATEYDARQIRTLTATDVVDASDRAARLLGIVYGSQSQQLKQTATNFNLQTELATGATLYDARQVRTLTTADAVTAAQGGAAAQSSRWPTFLSDGTAERIGQKTMAASLPVVLASDQSNIFNATQANAAFQQPRKLVTYNANFRLAARPYAISKLFTAGSRFQFATIHHAVGGTKTVKLRHVWITIESASAAGIIVVDLMRITAAPATGNPAITPSPANPGDAAAEATCLTLPTTAGTEGALQTFTEYNLGATGTGSLLNPPPDLVWRDLLTGASGFDVDNESKLQTIRASTLEGFAVTLDVSTAITVKGYVIMEFTEE